MRKTDQSKKTYTAPDIELFMIEPDERIASSCSIDLGATADDLHSIDIWKDFLIATS